MAWITPQQSRTAVDRAGLVLADYFTGGIVAPTDLDAAMAVVGNWRSSHSFPLQTLKMGLIKRAQGVDPTSLVAQRLKRLPSIALKLALNRNMKLSQMQDIGGCRAIVDNVSNLRELVKKFEMAAAKNPRRAALGPLLIEKYDYLSHPKDTGYRCVHFVYKYRSPNPALSAWNNLRIEIQVRSRLQHAWATAVETVGIFLKQALKSNQGQTDWLRFFALMGSAVAIREKTPLVSGTPDSAGSLFAEIRQLAARLDVMNRLNAYGFTVSGSETHDALKGGYYFLLVSRPAEQNVQIFRFDRQELDRATDAYLREERKVDPNSNAEVVLVSVESFQKLRRAYPNYFSDTKMFAKVVEETLKQS